MENLLGITNVYQFILAILILAIIPLSREIYAIVKKRNQKKRGNYVDLSVEIKKTSAEIKKISEIVKTLQIQIVGNQIVSLINFSPNETIEIEKMYDFYVKNGGNGYVKRYYDEWKNVKKITVTKRTKAV